MPVIDGSAIASWHFQFIIAGKTYTITELTLGTLASIPTAAEPTFDAAVLAAQINPLIAGDDKPDWQTAPIGDIIATLAGFEAYTKDYIAKKREAVREMIRHPSTASSSLPPC